VNVFSAIKQASVSPPILAYPDYSKQFILHTDANSLGSLELFGIRQVMVESRELSPMHLEV